MKTSKIKKEAAAGKSSRPDNKEIDIHPLRPELAEVIHRHSFGLDENRPEAVAQAAAKKPAHGPGQRRGSLRPRPFH